MENDIDLMAFSTWRAEQPEVERAAVVLSANDHTSKSCSVWWAGPETEFLDRLRAEARARGITLLVNSARYSKPELRHAVALIFAGRDRLAKLGFGLEGVGGPMPDFFGLTVKGVVLDDEEAQQLPPGLVASVRDTLVDLLHDAEVQPVDVRIEYGRTVMF